MSVETNKEIASRMPEAFNEGRLDIVDEVISADFTEHCAPMPGLPPGREGVKAIITAVRSAFPDLRNTVIRAIAEGDVVALHIRSTGTMKGDFMGMKPTGKTATWEVVHISRLQDGKIVEHWAVADNLGMLQQLGLAPAPSALAA